MHRTRGGLVAGGLFVLPSLFILIALSWIYMAFGTVPAIAGIFHGIKPAITAIVVFAAWRIGKRTLHDAWLWAIAAAAFVAIFAFTLPFPLIVLVAGVIGHFGGRLAPARFTAGAAHGGGARPDPRSSTTPSHALFDRARMARVLAAFVGLWSVATLALVLMFGRESTLVRMDWFFTKAAFLTFRRCVRGAAVRLPGSRRTLRLADGVPDDRWSGAGRNVARTADHGRGLRRLRRRLDP